MEQEQRQAAKRRIFELMQAGQPWQTATAAAGIQVSRSTAYRWQQEVRTRGEAALPDGRQGHPAKVLPASAALAGSEVTGKLTIQALKEWAPLEVEYYKKAYRAAGKGNYDIYVAFVEKGLSLLNKYGQLGFILPHKFFNAQYGEPLRALISHHHYLSEVVHFGDKQVFEQATTYTCLMFLDKAGSKQCRVVKVDDILAWCNTGEAVEGLVPAEAITQAEWNFNVGQGGELFDRLSQFPQKLGDIAHLFVGLQTDADDVYILEEIRRENERVLCASKSTGSQHWFEDDHLKPFLKGSLNIRRYYLTNVTKRLIFPYEIEKGKSLLIGETEYKQRYPLTWAYLEKNRELLSARNKGRMGQEWYGYVYKKNHTLLTHLKFLCHQ